MISLIIYIYYKEKKYANALKCGTDVNYGGSECFQVKFAAAFKVQSTS